MDPLSRDARILIVNADDFGLSSGVNAGIIEAHERGIVTSTSLMVRCPGVAEAADYARRSKTLGVGIHIDLGEWAYRDEEWVSLYDVVAMDDPAAIAEEVRRQIASFFDLVGRAPTHVDSHQHVHTEGFVRSIVEAAAAGLGAPLRRQTPNIQYCGDFYGQSAEGLPAPEYIGVEALCAVLRRLDTGITELACHPGYADELDTMYRAERALEVATLCDPKVRKVLVEEGIELRRFSDATVMERTGL